MRFNTNVWSESSLDSLSIIYAISYRRNFSRDRERQSVINSADGAIYFAPLFTRSLLQRSRSHKRQYFEQAPGCLVQLRKYSAVTAILNAN